MQDTIAIDVADLIGVSVLFVVCWSISDGGAVGA